MQEKIFKIDQGKNFGKWGDSISKLIYYTSTEEILKKIDIPDKVADYGGGNGILKEFIKNIKTIDLDGSKKPDIKDNILNHVGNYDLIIIRFVLHYLNDYDVIKLFNKINSFHKGKVLVIQFINDDLKSKYKNSINEFKYFRTREQMIKLLPDNKIIYSKDYIVTSKFYKNRLKLNNAIKHIETLNAYYF